MRPVVRHLLSRSAALSLAIGAAACSDFSNPTQPPAEQLFTTPTGLVTSTPPEIFVGAGDIATCSNNSDEATATLLDNIPGTVFLLGDNVYPNGTTSEFNNCYHPNWGRHKARTKPSAGNHDYNTSGASGYYAYFGAAAGDPSKGFYSFNLGAWHVVVLNSNISKSTTSAQGTWLRNDLAANQNLCTVAYFHHPLYSSSGGSGSGGVTYSSVRPLYDMLYAGGVDLVMAGHRHFYERLGRMKPDGTRDNVYGTRHIIAGMGGIGGGSVSNKFPTSEVANGDTRGVLKLYLYEDSYAWKFIPVAGKTFTDSGSTACHNAPGAPPPPPPGVSPSLSTVAVDSATLTAGSGSVATITVTARNANGSPVSGATVTLASTGSLNTLPQPGPTDANGVATSTISSSVAQPKIVSAIINNIPITQTDTVTVVPNVPVALFFAAHPSTTAGGATITPAVQVAVHDQFGNRVTNAINDVALTIAVNPGGGTLTGTTTVAAVGGLATFSDLSIDVAGIGYKIRADATGLTGVNSAAFDVTEAVSVPTALAFTVQPSTTAAGATITPAVQVTVLDQFGNPVTNATNDVTLAFGVNPGGGTLSGTTTVAAVGGVATFSNLSIDAAGIGYQVTAAAAGLTGATSSAFDVTVVPVPTALAFTVQPSTTAAGATITPAVKVTVLDQFGNPVTNATNDVTLAFGVNPGGGTLSGTTTVAAVGGVATFSNLSINAAGIGYQVTAAAAGLTGATSGAFDVTSVSVGTISQTLLTSGTDVNNVKIYTTASIAPAPNTLVTVAVLTHQSSAAAPAPTLTGGGMASWVLVATVAYNGATPLDRVSIYRAMSASPGSGPITITSSVTVSNCQWIVSQWSGVETTGANGAGAIGLTNSSTGAAVTGLTVSLASFASAANVAYGVFGIANATPIATAGSGFTAIAQQGSGESTIGSLFAEWAVNDNTIDATWPSKAAGALGVEIKAKTQP